MAGKYDRTVKAALSETASKFALAEALALDIPDMKKRNRYSKEPSLEERLQEAADAITAAGGESRSWRTLDEYRLVARWVSRGPEGSGSLDDHNTFFPWVEGVSFSVHMTACNNSLSRADLAGMPVKTVANILKLSRKKKGKPAEPEYDITCSVCEEVAGRTKSQMGAREASRTMVCAACAAPEDEPEEEGDDWGDEPEGRPEPEDRERRNRPEPEDDENEEDDEDDLDDETDDPDDESLRQLARCETIVSNLAGAVSNLRKAAELIPDTTLHARYKRTAVNMAKRSRTSLDWIDSMLSSEATIDDEIRNL